MSISLKGPTVLASFAVQPVTRETESERYFDNPYIPKRWEKMIPAEVKQNPVKMILLFHFALQYRT